MPSSVRSWTSVTAATLDHAVALAFRMSNQTRAAQARARTHDERMRFLSYVAEAYGNPRLITEPSAFFPLYADHAAASCEDAPAEPETCRRPPTRRPPPIAPGLSRVFAPGIPAQVLDASWPSNYEPYLEEVREKYLSHRRNGIAHARLFFGGPPASAGALRPVAILVHGYLGGHHALEQRISPVRWLLRRGLDVVLFVLPFHGLRAREDRGGGGPPFPGRDPRMTNEGFRQTLLDLQGLIAWLRRRGAPDVGLIGKSLGGYTTALAATVLSGLAFAVPMIPLASIAAFARDQGRLGFGPDAESEHDALEAATRVVSPFARASRIGKEKILIVAGEGDRITPMAHAERLALHFGAPLVRFAGGHLFQFGRRGAFREVESLLIRAGAISGG